MTPMAILCWFAWLGYMPVDGTWAFWVAKLPTALIFTLLAVSELVADKLPKIGDRTSPGPLAARLIFAGLIGAIIAAGLNGSGIEGVFLAVACSLAGAFCGFLLRRELVRQYSFKDWYVAVAEDIFTVGCAILAMGVITG
jgi:uncharacterized membrane protein